MRRLMALLVVGFVVFVAVYRQRLFLRDPLATVTRDGVRAGGVSVMINYSNDVLLEDGSRIYLVQGWDEAAGVPAGTLKCFRGLVCMTEADRAAVVRLGGRTRAGVTMTNRRVKFVDEEGRVVEVLLR